MNRATDILRSISNIPNEKCYKEATNNLVYALKRLAKLRSSDDITSEELESIEMFVSNEKDYLGRDIFDIIKEK